MTDIVEWTRTCQECKTDEHIVDETTRWTSEQWSNFQRNLSAPLCVPTLLGKPHIFMEVTVPSGSILRP